MHSSVYTIQWDISYLKRFGYEGISAGSWSVWAAAAALLSAPPRLICLGLKAANKIAFQSTSDEARLRYSDGVGAAHQLIQAVGVAGALPDATPRYLAFSLSYSSALTADLREIAIEISSGVVSG